MALATITFIVTNLHTGKQSKLSSIKMNYKVKEAKPSTFALDLPMNIRDTQEAAKHYIAEKHVTRLFEVSEYAIFYVKMSISGVH